MCKRGEPILFVRKMSFKRTEVKCTSYRYLSNENKKPALKTKFIKDHSGFKWKESIIDLVKDNKQVYALSVFEA